MLWKMGFSAAKILPCPPYMPLGTIEIREGFGPLELSWVFRQSEKLRQKPRFFLLPAKIEFLQSKSKQIESLPDSICGKMGTKYRFELPRF